MDNKIRVLVLEDNATDAELVERALSQGSIDFVAKRVDTKDDFVQELSNFEPNLILADYSLPSFGGMAALEIARNSCPDVPFVVVSGTIGEEFAIETLKQGATDYVLKQRLSRLVPVVRRSLREAEQSRQRKLAEEALRENEKKYRELFNNLSDAVFLYELRKDGEPGRFLEVNEGACRMLGYERYELLEMSRLDIEEQDGAKRLVRLLRNRMQNGNFSFAGNLIARNGIRVPAEINTRIFVMRGTQVVLSIARDITDRKIAQEKQERLIRELQQALAHVKSLKGLLPMCAWCKKIRDDKGYWLEVEAYLHEHSDVDFSHGICPECTEKYKKMHLERRAT